MILATVLQASLAGTPQRAPVLMSQEQRQSLDPIGNCQGSRGSVDMHRVMFLENRSVDVDGPNGSLRVSVQGEDLFVDETANGSQEARYFINIDSEINAADDLDIELKLAYFERRLVLYWRETFQNRIYRQGLFDIVGHEVRVLCDGEGGRHVER